MPAQVVALLLAALLGLFASLGQAQETADSETPVAEEVLTPPLEQDPYYTAWKETARRAESAIEADRASNAALEELRAQLVDYRQTFLEERDRNSSRIKTLKSQLSTLGEAPADGEEEPAGIADLRARLNAQLSDLQVPSVVAQEAYTRADGLISELDRIARERQTRELLSRGETPLNPVGWTTAVKDLTALLRDLRNETVSSWQAARDLNQLRDNAPLILLFTIAGLVLLVRGRGWAERAGGRLQDLGGRGTKVWRFVVSLGRIGLPLLGLYLITRAVTASEAVGLRGSVFLGALPVLGAIILGFLWLGDQVYSKRDRDALIPLPAPARAAARRNFLYLALLLALYRIISLIETVQPISEAARAVLVFPVILISAAVLLQLRRIILIDDPDTETMPAGMRRMAPGLRFLSLLAAGAAPLLSAAGYQTLAEAIVFPAMMTIAVVCMVLVLQRFVSDLYGWLSGRGAEVEETIVPALAGFALSVLSLPVLALIWGARVADLTEVWARFLAGFNVGDTNISPIDFLTFAMVFGIGYAATRAFQGALKGSLLPRTRLDAGGQNAVISGTGYVGIMLAALAAITAAGIDLSSLAIVAGALSVGIGFGLQNIVSNFVSGIILLIERPISEGDWIEVNGQMGYVRDISVRSTRIETFDRTDVIVPNADLVSGIVTNYTRGNTVGRVIVPVGVAYGTETKRVESILREIANAHPMVLANPAPNVVFQGFGADSLDFEIRAILRDVNWVLSVKSDMNHAIAERFAEEGIEIPFAQRDIWLRNPEALRPGDPAPSAGREEGANADPQQGRAED
ncbi:DUF3772 domain-containing protein [Aquicoccus sp. SU-CL01552]|uniref:DUF3772 domain-containing protein n=1 Tax=Aquicoccus sp. SU-CL01552 TaxID=3127656 RepID=UPI00310BE91B